MNTIHSSSLAFYPVGYNRPSPERLQDRKESNPTSDATKSNAYPQEQASPKSSSTAQIKAALAEYGLTITENDNRPTDARSIKAISAYIENRNQPAQMKVAESVFGIDFYV